ncbi:transposase [Ktedonobacter sp. SOSP1-52]|uniref:IS3 family transposase n=1 Tax=Ktedonobacter sp. SOSP1-52 TaxID=2778366 RepID=UPI001A2D8AC7|nr:IS3 family transposase [Ktedonobacter sp. SOSP1-52]GHO71982.1 transposase [Ktedonobacter sp. SOSP1-52]
MPLSTRQLCQLLQINRAWYYAKQHKGTTSHAQEEQVALRDEIEQIVLQFPGYGYRRVTAALKRAGWCVNHKRVLRIMREESLLCHLKRHFVRTTDAHHPYTVYPNLVNGRTPDAPDVIWVADLTYIRLRNEFVYLACILDASSRRCVGWNLSRRMDAGLVLGALEVALAIRDVKPGLIHHSDRGVQYACIAYVERLESMGIQISMSAKGNVYDNAKAESFFKTLKQEEVYLKAYQTFEEARNNIGHFLDDVYNTKRLHSSLGYVPPAEFEAAYYQQMLS